MTGRRQPLVLLAASGLAREVMASVAMGERFEVIGVLDDDPSRQGAAFGSSTIVGGISEAENFPDAQFVACAGRGAVRELIVARLKDRGIGSDRYATVIDPTAVIPGGSAIGVGSVMLSHVSLTAEITVGQHVVVMPQAVLTHDNRIADYVTICAGVALGGSVQVGTAAYLGMNASVRQDVQIGEHSTLGMGSVLLRDLPAGRTWLGVPAADLAGRGQAIEQNVREFVLAQPTGGMEGGMLP